MAAMASSSTSRTGDTIGGDQPGDSNLISGNDVNGIDLLESAADIVGNLIGVDRVVAAPIENGVGGIDEHSSDDESSTDVDGDPISALSEVECSPEPGISGINAPGNNEVFAQAYPPFANALLASLTKDYSNFEPFGEDFDRLMIRRNLVSYRIYGVSFNALLSKRKIVVVTYIADGTFAAINFPTPQTTSLEPQVTGGAPLPIDLGGDGPTPNDPGDADDGPNGLQNYPVITSAETGIQTVVTGTLNSLPDRMYRLDFYTSANDLSPGNPLPAVYLGWGDVETDASGNAPFAFLAQSAGGQFVTATATLVESGTLRSWDLGILARLPNYGHSGGGDRRSLGLADRRARSGPSGKQRDLHLERRQRRPRPCHRRAAGLHAPRRCNLRLGDRRRHAFRWYPDLPYRHSGRRRVHIRRRRRPSHSPGCARQHAGRLRHRGRSRLGRQHIDPDRHRP